MRRIVAVVVAAGLVVGAVIVRRAIDGDGGGDPNNPEGFPTTRLVCAEELRTACEALGFGASVDVTIEDASVTAARLATAAAAVDVDVWAVPAPWPGIVDDERGRAGLDPLFAGADADTPVARSPLVVLGPDDLNGCEWRCIGDNAGSVRFGSRAPASGFGALLLGALATGWFGSTDFAANDFDAAFTTWLTTAAAAVTPEAQPVTRLLQSRAFFDAAVSFEAEATGALDTASSDRKAGLTLLYPQPVTTLDALVVRLDDGVRDLRSSIGSALVDFGWQEPGDDTATTLPRPGVLVALQDLL